MSIKLSLCMIVKDEEAVISRCLAAVAPLVDEIVIVDTGSTDSTKQICGRFTDKIFDFRWKDDFAAARNFSFSKATGDYILWLDADDVVTEENAEILKDLKEKLALDAADVVMCRYDTSFDENSQPTFSFFRERILRRAAGFKWEAFIHECIAPRGKIIYSDFSVEHRKLKDVGSRNLGIFQRKIGAGAVLDGRGLFYYGRELFYNKMYVEGAAVLERAIEKGAELNLTEACLFLSDCYIALGEEKKAFRALCRSFENLEPRADVLCKIAVLCKKNGNYAAAIFWFKAATECPDVTKKGEFDRSEYRNLIPFIELSCCFFYSGDTQKARYYHEKARKLRPNHPAVVYNERFFQID